MKRSCMRLLALIAAVGILAAACGSEDGGGIANGIGAIAEDTAAAEDTAPAEDMAGPEGAESGDSDSGDVSEPGEIVESGDEPDEPGDETCIDEDVLCIGLVTDSNQAASETVGSLHSTFSARVELVEIPEPAAVSSAVRALLDEDHDIIVTVGAGLGEATRRAATANPGTYFIGVEQFQDGEIPNLAGLVFEADKVGFLAGALAGLLTETGTVAQVLGTDLVEPVVALKEGFVSGVAHTNPDADVISTYHPGSADLAFTDPEWGAGAAREALGSGADVIFGAGGSTGDGALAEAAKERGLALCIGADVDQWVALPEVQPCLVTSAVKMIMPGINAIVTDWQGGNAPTGNVFGDVGLAGYRDFAFAVDTDIQDLVADVVDQLSSGDVPTGYESS